MAEFDYKEYAKQMRKNAVKDANGIVVCSPELWEQIASMIERIPLQHPVVAENAITALREKCIEHQDFHKGDDGKFRAYISIEDLDVIIDELQNIQ